MIRAQDQDIQSLVADISDGKLLLPEMQRRYVWKSTQICDLFDSLYYEYPSGQLLVWETDDLPAAGNRGASIQGITAEDRHPQLLLDGQQRLTSLAAIMLGRDLLVRDAPKPIDIAFNVYTEKFEVAGPRQRGQSGWISLVKFFTGGITSAFIDLKLDYNAPETKAILDHLNKLENIKKYKYRVNVLERLSYAEVTHIFVRTNSGGTTLSYADLALAQVSSSWRGVTGELESHQKHINRQNSRLELDNGLLLRTIVALLTGQSRFTRFFRGDQQQVTIDDLKAAWERAKKALDQSISFLKIIKANWALFQDVFGKEATLDQYAHFATSARNTFKHGNDLSNVDLASAEAELLWLEECLRHVQLETGEDEEPQVEAI